jgi:hypothetical protein
MELMDGNEKEILRITVASLERRKEGRTRIVSEGE